MTTAVMESPRAPGLLDLPGCEFTPVSLTLPKDLTYDQWERIGRQLQLADMAIQWWIGDWLVYGQHKWREKYAQAVQRTGKAEQTLMNYAFVAKAISPSRRREQVDFTTHAEVASLDEEDQERILAKAANEGLSMRRVRREAQASRRAKRPNPEDDEVVLSKEARKFLDEYMGELALWPDKLPITLTPSERDALEKMIYGQGASALWVKNRTRQTDYAAIVELFSFDEGTPGMERAGRADISSWLEKCGYYMSDSDLDERLDSMVEKKMLEVHSVEESRQDGRRGVMLDLYALSDEYVAQLEADK
jgi:hypothetical protein